MWNMELWNSQSGTSVAQIYSGTSYYPTLTIGPLRQAHSGAFALADDVIDCQIAQLVYGERVVTPSRRQKFAHIRGSAGAIPNLK
jgi:hypothetical protein